MTYPEEQAPDAYILQVGQLKLYGLQQQDRWSLRWRDSGTSFSLSASLEALTLEELAASAARVTLPR